MPVTCEIRDDILIVKFVLDYSHEEYVTVVEAARASDAFRAGMPVLLDVRSSTQVLSGERYKDGFTHLATLGAPGAMLRVALITSYQRIPVAQRAVGVLASHGILARVFMDTERALDWLRAATGAPEITSQSEPVRGIL